jgi:hypothetical protein
MRRAARRRCRARRGAAHARPGAGLRGAQEPCPFGSYIAGSRPGRGRSVRRVTGARPDRPAGPRRARSGRDHILPTVYLAEMSGFNGIKHWRRGAAHLCRPGVIPGNIVSAETILAIESCRAPGKRVAIIPVPQWRGTAMSTPGRSRTDTGDPFRGPASSLGLRGRIHNTARTIAEPVSSKDLFRYFSRRPRFLHTNCRA